MLWRVGKLSRILLRPKNIRVIARDMSNRLPAPGPDYTHLDEAMRWLCRAQDAASGGGVSGGYFMDRGWDLPYPETTGYIIPTFLEYAQRRGTEEFVDRAIRMGDWEIKIQLDSGAVRGGVGVNEYPIVFNTGQVIFGWNALYRRTKQQRFLDASERAAQWLVRVQDDDGKWSKHTYMGIPHAYKTRVAWALFETSELTGDSRFSKAAEKNIQWTLSLAGDGGWIDHMGFTPTSPPLTHTIAYTHRGLWESARYLASETAAAVEHLVVSGADRIIEAVDHANEEFDLLAGRLARGWIPAARFSCLTGSVQMAGIWLKIFQKTGQLKYRQAAHRLIDGVKSTQSLDSGDPGIRGGIAGSYPIWGSYIRFGYPNWAAKFFADAILARETAGRVD